MRKQSKNKCSKILTQKIIYVINNKEMESENMKFIHIADMHFDAPFITVSDEREFCKLRRLEQREVFKKIIDYINENEIPYLFISGDLYEHKYIRQSTIEYINSLFKKIPNTKVFISPGNHDPYLKNSFYNNYIWSENVTIFTPEINKISLEDVNIYGYGFEDFYSTRVNINNIRLDEPEKLNILVIHGTLDGSDAVENNYNPISKKILGDIGFDYVALGHIHKKNYIQTANQKIIYPGSTISLGFDELGEHGMILGDLNKNNLQLNFIKLDTKIFEEKDIDVSNINSEDDLLQKLNEMELEDNHFYKINLIGTRRFEININEIKKLNTNQKILKIKNKTKIGINIEKIAKEATLAGMFANEILEEINNKPTEADFLSEVLEIGLEILDK
jgi:DNA repair exonuclease SbcCD nuclease subunit